VQVLVVEMGGECGHGGEEDEVSELHKHHYEAVVCCSRSSSGYPVISPHIVML